MKETVKSICKRMNFSRTLFYYWKNKFESGDIFASNKRGRKTIINEILKAFIKSKIEKSPGLTIIELTRLCLKSGFACSGSTVYKVLYNCLNYRFKKKKIIILPSSFDKTVHNAAIKNKQKELKNAGIGKVISIDESAFYDEMVSYRGWCQRGKEIKLERTKMRFQKYSLLMAITSNRIIDFIITKGSINGEIFEKFINSIFPKINSREKNLLMDNVSFHKSTVIKKLLVDKGINPIYTVPYTPDLNPIENVFSSIKSYVKKKNPKSSEELLTLITKATKKIKGSSLRKMYKRSYGLTEFEIKK